MKNVWMEILMRLVDIQILVLVFDERCSYQMATEVFRLKGLTENLTFSFVFVRENLSEFNIAKNYWV